MSDDERQVTVLLVTTEEPITPSYLACRVALACGQRHALRPGESVMAANDPDGIEYVITEESFEWPPATT